MKDYIRFIAILAILIWLSFTASTAFGQTDDKPICISRQAAETCATNAERIKALESQIATLEQALKDKDGIINGLKIEAARYSGRIESCEKNDASNRAIIEVLIKNARPKRIGLINIF